MPFDVSESLPDGLTYTEEAGLDTLSLPMRLCLLWLADDSETGRTEVGGLNLLSFQQRFGSVAVPAEGIGGVETHVPYRRRGYAGVVLRHAAQNAAGRVPVLWVSDAIEHLYEKLGYVTCLLENELELQVHHVERYMASAPLARPPRQSRQMTEDDLPAMVAIYNRGHRRRTWTHQRHPAWNRLLPRTTWRSGSDALVLQDGEGLAGYALFSGDAYGHAHHVFRVYEAIATDLPAAHQLLVLLAERAREWHQPALTVPEPADSMVGLAARQIGCRVQRLSPASGGMMGKILDRHDLLQRLEPELRRRLEDSELAPAHHGAFRQLLSGALYADDGVLLRLLTGFWSAQQAAVYGHTAPDPLRRLVAAWFPEAGSRRLCIPHNHLLDRY